MSKPATPTFYRFRRAIRGLPNGCVVFTGHIRRNGYGAILHNGEKQLVHRVAYELFVGPIPEGFQVDHLCKNRACVYPHHLEAVPAAENNRRSDSTSAINARRTHCIYGHAFTPENTRIARGRRYCRQCDADRHAAVRKATRA